MPSFYLPKIPLHDPMVDTVEESIHRVTQTSNNNFDIIKRLMYGQLDSVNVRSGGILLEDLMGGLLPQEPEALGIGLNLTASHMGYFDGELWQAYINDQGDFYFGGDSDNYIYWNGTILDIAGSLSAVTGTFQALAAGDLDASYIAMGVVGEDPLIELHDADNNLRIEIEKDRMSFYTEDLYDEETLVAPSVYAGMIQGVYWDSETYGNKPEVRINVPQYCNILADDPNFSPKFSRFMVLNTDNEIEAKMQVVNLPDDGGDPFVAETFTEILMDVDLKLHAGFGNIYGLNRLVLNSSNFDDHLVLSRYNSENEETYSVHCTSEFATKSILLVMTDDTEKIIIANADGGSLSTVLEVSNIAGSGTVGAPHVAIFGDLYVDGDITYAGENY